jgi:hypothetical protein
VLKKYVFVAGFLTIFLCSHLLASDGIHFAMELFYSSVPRDLGDYRVVKKFPARTRYSYDIRSVEIEYHNGRTLSYRKNIRRYFDISFDNRSDKIILEFTNTKIAKNVRRITLKFKES